MSAVLAPSHRPSDLLSLGTRFCLCRTCNQYFASPGTFDTHRYGPYTDRRCYTEFEMSQRGFETNPRGLWRQVVVRIATGTDQ